MNRKTSPILGTISASTLTLYLQHLLLVLALVPRPPPHQAHLCGPCEDQSPDEHCVYFLLVYIAWTNLNFSSKKILLTCGVSPGRSGHFSQKIRRATEINNTEPSTNIYK